MLEATRDGRSPVHGDLGAAVQRAPCSPTLEPSTQPGEGLNPQTFTPGCGKGCRRAFPSPPSEPESSDCRRRGHHAQCPLPGTAITVPSLPAPREPPGEFFCAHTSEVRGCVGSSSSAAAAAGAPGPVPAPPPPPGPARSLPAASFVKCRGSRTSTPIVRDPH